MAKDIRFYDRALSRLSRRAAAERRLEARRRGGDVAAGVRRAYWRSRSSARIRSRSASRPAIRCPTASCCGRGSRPSRSTAAACRRRPSRWAGRSPRDRDVRDIVQQGHGDRAARAGPQRARRGRRARARPRILLPLPRRRRGQPDRPHRRPRRAAGAPVDRLRFAVCGCSHYETGYFTAYRRISPTSSSTSSSTPATTSTRAAPTAAAIRTSCAQHHGQEIYTLVDYRNRYAQYKSDPDLLAAHAVGAVHRELGRSRGRQRLRRRSPTSDDTPPEVFLLRRAAAYQAYYEHMPLRRAALPDGSRDCSCIAACSSAT